MTKVDKQLLINSLTAIGELEYKERTINLFTGHEDNIEGFLNEFLDVHPDKEFIGLPHVANSRKHLVIDGPILDMWKDTDISETPIDWKITPTGVGTYNNVFPESANSLRFDEDPDHWCYLCGFMEVGSANNILKMRFLDINGTIQTSQQVAYQSRVGEIRVVKLMPALKLRTRGTVQIQFMFETTADTEIIPICIHILPQEISESDDPDDFVSSV